MLKTKTKLIITFAIIAFAMCLLNVNSVNAANLTEEEIQKMLDVIPDEITLDITEYEAIKASDNNTKGDDKLQEKLNEIWKSNNLSVDNGSVYTSCGRLGIMQNIDEFYKSRIVVEGKEKTISIKYNNSNEKNSTDEQRAKNVKINYPDYIPVTKNQILNMYNHLPSALISFIKENISLNDSSFIFEVDSGVSAIEYGFPMIAINEGGLTNGKGNINVGIFKNGILYDLKNIPCNIFQVIDVPNNISKDNLKNYIISYLNEMESQSGYPLDVTDIDLIEGAFISIPNVYTIKVCTKDFNATYTAILNFQNDEIVTLKENIILGNEIVSGLMQEVKADGYNPICITLSSKELTKILINKQKLDSLVHDDNYVYDNIYLKVNDNETSAKVKYDDNITKDLEIVDIDNIKYFKCPIGYIIKENNEYYLGGLCSDGHGREFQHGNHGSGTIVISNNNDENTELKFFTEFYGKNGGKIDIVNEKGNSLSTAGSGDFDYAGYTVSRDRVAEGDCYIVYEATTYLGETINLEHFGALHFVDIDEPQSWGNYIYKAKINDKTIFNVNEIFGKIVMPEYELCTTYSINFEGNLIDTGKPNETVTKTDTTTNIVLETDTNVVPQNTELKVTPILEGESYNRIKTILDNVNKFVAFDISLLSDGIEIQPNGNVKISIPIPEGYDISKLAIYRIEENGTKIEYAVNVVTIDDKQYAQFETNHFSDYVLAEQEQKMQLGTQSDPEHQKDDTPKTGKTDIVNYIGVLALISIVGVIILKKGKI